MFLEWDRGVSSFIVYIDLTVLVYAFNYNMFVAKKNSAVFSLTI